MLAADRRERRPDPVLARRAVPRFEPFTGIVYETDRVRLSDVVSPPYDVLDEADRQALEALSPYNAVRIDLPRDTDRRDRYAEARCLLDTWLSEGVLRRDPEPTLYVYRMGFYDEAGRARQTAGVIGAMEISPVGEGDVLPHEHTMSKPKDDRLNMRRSCNADMSPIWGLSLAAGLSALCEMPGGPDLRVTDPDGVHHRLWRITQPGMLDAISEAVASAPVMIADGHHRYETATAHRDEMHAAGKGPGGHDLVMTYVVELTEEQLAVRPIHRLLRRLPAGVDLVEALGELFEVVALGVADPGSMPDRMVEAGGLGLVVGGDGFLLVPRPGKFDGVDDVDSAYIAHAIAGIGERIDVSYQHGAGVVADIVAKGDADAAVLLRPVSVDKIAATARARQKMPPKSTFFHPKLRTGLVFRPLD